MALMTARYDATCRGCQEAIHKGDPMRYENGRTWHPDCWEHKSRFWEATFGLQWLEQQGMLEVEDALQVFLSMQYEAAPEALRALRFEASDLLTEAAEKILGVGNVVMFTDRSYIKRVNGRWVRGNMRWGLGNMPEDPEKWV